MLFCIRDVFSTTAVQFDALPCVYIYKQGSRTKRPFGICDSYRHIWYITSGSELAYLTSVSPVLLLGDDLQKVRYWSHYQSHRYVFLNSTFNIWHWMIYYALLLNIRVQILLNKIKLVIVGEYTSWNVGPVKLSVRFWQLLRI